MTTQTIDALSFTLADRMTKSLRVSHTGVGEIAEYMGVSRATVANWTSGRTSPHKGVLHAWATRTGVPYEWLVDECHQH
jgi:transcriptional regulator with XRE-family HTH domain